MSSPSRFTARVACKILGISALLSLLFLAGCTTSGNTETTIGSPAKLAFTVQPASVAAGSSITPAVTVSIEDSQGNVVTTATNQVTIALGTNPSAGTLAGTAVATAVNGVATFSNLSINNAGTGYTLAASATSLTSATSNGFNVFGTATKLAFTTQPSLVAAGSSITPAVTVSVEDSLGNVVPTATSQVTIAIGTNPSAGTLGGTLTVAAVNGVATFSSLNINKTGTGYTLMATATNLTAATSSAFNVNPGAASKLVFVQQPTNVVAGSAIAPAVTVSVEDSLGNLVTSATNSITLGIGTGTGPLNGTATQAAAAGVATFSGLSLNTAGTGDTLTASATGLTGATSSTFNVTVGAPAKLVFTTEPSNVTASSAITPSVQVSIEDAVGNVVTTAANAVTVGIGTGTGPLNGTLTQTAVNGVATFPGLGINTAGIGDTLTAGATGFVTTTSTPFNVTAAAASKLVFTQQPTNVPAGGAITPSVQVSIEDTFNNVVTAATNSITVALGTGNGTLSGTATQAAVSGVATFTGLSINLVGTGDALTAGATGFTTITSNPFNVTVGAPSKLVFTQQPTNVTAGSAITPSVLVSIEDTNGNVVTSATNSITLGIGTGTGPLNGTATQAAVAGVASFSGLSLNTAGTGDTLTAGATGFTTITSSTFNVTAGAVSKLAFMRQPANVAAGSAITPSVQVSIEDTFGNVVLTATNSITVGIGTGTGPLNGTTTQAAVSGVATFPGLMLDTIGTGDTLTAGGTGFTTITSSPFNVTAATASKLVFTQQPTNVTAGSAIAPSVQVSVEDTFGNVVTSATNSITLGIGTGTGPLNGTATQAAVAGVATFPGLSLSTAGTGDTLTAGATGLTIATSSPFNVTAGTGSKLVFTQQPTNVAAGGAITPSVQVSVEDTFGNLVLTATNSITVALGTGTGPLNGTLTQAAVSGVATFSGLSLNTAGTGDTLTAGASSFTTITSTAFNVTAGGASKLVFTQQPTNVTAGSAITPSVQVSVEDTLGNLVLTATNSITVALGAGTGPLNGTLTQAAASGVATFPGLSLNTVGTGDTLTAGATGFTTITSTTFNVTVGSASKLVFTQQPTNVTAGSAIAPSVQVSVEDTFGNVVTTATNAITVGIGTGTGPLNGTTTQAAVSGVANFAGLSLNTAGTGETLTAGATGFTAITSSTFNVTAGTATKLAFIQQPTNVVVSTSITPAVTVGIEDSFGNVVTGATNSITIALGAGDNGALAGTATQAAVSGVATFSNLSISATGIGDTLTAGATGFSTITSSLFNVVVSVGPPSKLAFTTSPPSTVVAGNAISPSLQVSVEDASGNVVNTATNTITISFGVNPLGATLGGTLSVAAVNGVATFSTITIDVAANGYSLQAGATGLSSGSSTTFNVTSASASKLVFTQQPTNVAAGSAITPSVQVSIEDTFGNVVTSATNSITVAPGTGTGALNGTLTQAAVSGVATFPGLSIDVEKTGNTLTAGAASFTTITSSTFNVTAGTATKLVFTQQPTNVAAGGSITPSVQVSVEDTFGNVVSTATNAITVGIGTGTGPVNGTLTQAAVAGVATFPGVSLNTVGTGDTLTAGATGFTTVTSSTFNVTAGSASKLVFTQQPTNVTAGGSITPSVQVSVEDTFGNVVSTATNAITVGIGTGTGPVNGTLTQAAVAGVATFPGLSLNTVGTGDTLTAGATGFTTVTSSTFNVTAGSASKLVFTQQPTNVTAGSAITPSVQVSIEDTLGNVVLTATNSITVALGTGTGPLNGTLTQAAVSGVAIFPGLSLNTAGTADTLTAGASGFTTITSTTFNVTAGGASKLVFTQQPTNVTAGSAITPSVQVSIEDTNGNVVTTAANSITLGIGTGFGPLNGTTTQAAVSGVAIFPGLSLNAAGTGDTLTAGATGFTAITSTPFNVTAGGASKLAFTQQPTNVTAGSVITPSVQVSIEDTLGNVVLTATNSITVALGAGTGPLNGTLTQAAVAGIATFSNLSLTATGTGDTLTASATGFTTITSGTFNVTAGTATKLVFVQQPSNVVAGTSIAPAVTVAIEDAQGNIVTNATNQVSIGIGTNAGSGSLSGGAAVSPASGVATFSNLSINNAGNGYTLTASATGFTTITSTAFNVTSASTSLTLTGTLSYSGSPVQTGNIIIRVFPNYGCTNCGQQVVGGTSLPNQNGTFSNLTYTVRGLAPIGNGLQNYIVTAEIDTLGIEITNESNPEGSSGAVTTGTVPNITIVNRMPTSLAGQTVSGFSVSPTNNAAVVMYNPLFDSNGEEEATSYTVSYGTGTGNFTNEGSQVFKAQGKGSNILILTGLTNGVTNFEITANNSGGSSSPTTLSNVTVGPGSGGFSVTGTVTFPGSLPAGAPLYAGVYSTSTGQVYTTQILNPVSPQLFTVSNVPNGTYQVFAIIDVNKNGQVDAGDLNDIAGNSSNPTVTVSGATAAAGTVALGNAASTITIGTNVNGSSGQSSTYSINIRATFGAKLPISMTLLSGPNVVVPYDMNADEHSSSYNPIFSNSVSPLVGDTYQLLVTFSDESTATIPAQVTAVLAFPTPIAMNSPVAGSAPVPVLNWAAPSPLPTSLPYSYSVNLNNSNGTAQENWSYYGGNNSNGIPSTQTSVVFDTDGSASPSASLTPGGTYNWSVSVSDNSNNSATYSASYTVPGGVGPAAKLAFTVQPPNASAGSTISPSVQVTIQDASGNTVISATNTVSLSILNNAGGGTLSGGGAVSPVNGVATFSNLSINNPGTGYTLSATASSPPTLTGATSNAFNVAGSASQIGFLSQPPSTIASGTTIAPPIHVAIEDAFGRIVTNAVAQGYTTIKMGDELNGGPDSSVSGTLTQSVLNGEATFNNLSISTVATGYQLAATSTSGISFIGGGSISFNVITGTPAVTINVPGPLGAPPIQAGGGATTISIAVASDVPGEKPSVSSFTLNGVACTTATCGSLGAVTGTAGSGNYTVQYTPPATLIAQIAPTLVVQTSVAGLVGTTSFTVYPPGVVVVLTGFGGNIVNPGSPARTNYKATVYNDTVSGGVGSGITLAPLMGSGFACPNNSCGTWATGTNTTSGTTTTIPITYTPPASGPPSPPYDRPLIVATSVADPTKLATTAFLITNTPVAGTLSIATNQRLDSALTGGGVAGAPITVSAGFNDASDFKSATWTLSANGVTLCQAAPNSSCSSVSGNLSVPATTVTNGNSVTSTVTYTPPATVPTGAGQSTPTLTATMTANPAATDSFSFTIVNGACGSGNESILNGQYAFLAKGGGAGSGYDVFIGSFHADGAGHIMSGFEDINRTTGSTIGSTLTGSYSVGSDNRGCLTLTNSNGGTATYRIALGTLSGSPTTATQGSMTFFGDNTGQGMRLSGILKQQNLTGLSSSTFSGTYVIGEDGVDDGGHRFAGAGLLTSNGVGSDSNISLDIDDNGSTQTLSGGTGTYSLASGAAGGRGTFSTTLGSGTSNGVIYIVSSSDALIMGTDPVSQSTSLFGGELRKQTGTFNANTLDGKNYVGYVSGVDSSNGGNVVALDHETIATFGSSTSTLDINDNGIEQSEQTGSTTYNVTSTGRTTLTGGGGKNPILYLIDSTQGFLVGTDSNDFLGYFQQQTGGPPFTTSSVSGQYTIGGSAANSGSGFDSGVVTFNSGSATLSGTLDDSSPNFSSQGCKGSGCGGLLPNDTIPENGNSGAYTVSTPLGQVSGGIIGYVVSPAKIMLMQQGGTTQQNSNPAEIFIGQQ